MSRRHQHIECFSSGWLLVVALLAGMLSMFDSHQVIGQTAEAAQGFDEGTRYLEDGQFREALSAFDSAEVLGLGSGALFYNQGVAHYRLEEIGQAIRYFERASRLLPDDPRIQHNLEIVAGRITDRFSDLPPPVWKKLQRVIIARLSVENLLLIGLGFYFLFIALVIMKVRGTGRGRWFRHGRITSALLALIFLITGFSSSIWPAYPSQAVILVQEASLHEQPDAEATVTMIVHEGLVVSTVASGENWVLVQLPNGARGWITEEGLGEI